MRMFFEVVLVFVLLFGLSYLSRRMERWYKENKPKDLPTPNDGSPSSAMLWIAEDDPDFEEIGKHFDMNQIDKKG